MKNKKSNVAIQVIIFLAIGAFVFLVLANIVPKLLGKSGSETSGFLSSSRDYDNDGVADYFDKCKCSPGENEDGCPTGTDPDASGHNAYCDCPDGMVPAWADNTCP